MPRVSKRFIYQCANWQLPTTTSLQAAITSALHKARERERAQPLTEGATDTEGTWRKLVRGLGRNGCMFGKLVQYTHGMKQETVKTRVTERTQPQEGALTAPEGEEFSEGALYFCIDGNHVVVAQSQSLRIGNLEAYLNWLLREQTGVVPAENLLSLESIPSAEARRILSRVVPKSVTFSRPVQLGREETVTGAHRYSTSASIDAIQALMGVDDLRGMLPAEALAEGRVQTSVTLYWNTHVGGQKPEAFLKGLGRFALRHMDEDPEAEVEIETAAGKFSRRHLSIAESRNIEAHEGVVVVSTVYTAMLEFLSKLRQERQIED